MNKDVLIEVERVRRNLYNLKWNEFFRRYRTKNLHIFWCCENPIFPCVIYLIHTLSIHLFAAWLKGN